MGRAEPSQFEPSLVPRARAVCAIFHAETKEGADDAFARLVSDLAHTVRADEPGCESYVATRAMGSMRHFVMHARFLDWAAFEDHADTAHMRRLMPRLSALLVQPLAMEIYLEL
jgi:quinol monooxygenase YgiN